MENWGKGRIHKKRDAEGATINTYRESGGKEDDTCFNYVESEMYHVLQKTQQGGKGLV